MDTEEFLASLAVSYSGVARDFTIVTQKYGKGIVEYGQKSTTTFPATGPGGKYTDICDEDGVMFLRVDVQNYSATAGFANLTTPAGFAASGFTVTYRVYEDLEFEDEIGEVSFDLSSVTVSVTERKLRASWSPELAQDVSAFHNIDAEAELTALLSEGITMSGNMVTVDLLMLVTLKKTGTKHW